MRVIHECFRLRFSRYDYVIVSVYDGCNRLTDVNDIKT